MKFSPALVQHLTKLGFLPSPTARYLPHNGTSILRNLEHAWVRDCHRSHSLYMEPPDTDPATDGYEGLVKESNNRAVSYIKPMPVYTDYVSKACSACAELEDTECCDGMYDISRLGFTEDKLLHTLRFYNNFVTHAGYLEFDQRKDMFSKYERFFKFIAHFKSDFYQVKSPNSNDYKIVYSLEDGFTIPLQETRFMKHEHTSVLQTTNFLTHWYLAITLDKFLHDTPPRFSAFHPRIAPCHVAVVKCDPGNEDVSALSDRICAALNSNGVIARVFESQIESGMLGIPFDLLIDEQTVIEERVSVFGRTNGSYDIVPDINKLPEIFRLFWSSVVD
eukprot:sb/3466582/